MLAFVRYFGVYCTFGLLGCVSYNEDFVISRSCPNHFTVTLDGRNNIVRSTVDFVMKRFLKSRFYYSLIGMQGM